MSERDLRSEFLNTLLTTPHRDLAALQAHHNQIIANDPRFYVHVAAWYADKGQVRDHKELFVIMLCLSSFEGHREVGLALLRRLPPYQVARVVDYIKGGTVTERRQVGRPAQQPEVELVAKQVGLGRNVPRSMRTEIHRYLREREVDPNWFDRSVLTARKPMKRLYAGLHIRPSQRAQAILFDDDPPPDSLSFKLKQIANAATPGEQARAIAQYQIPYRVAASVVREMTPMVLAALIDVMTPQEVINNVASLKRRGAFDNPEVKALIDAKLTAAQKDERVSAYKAKVAAEAAGATGELAEALGDVTESQVKAAGAITRSTALLIDKSGSMEVAIEVGRQLGALISAICQADLYAYAFDSVAYEVKPKGSSLADWEKALTGIRAAGATSCGVAIEWLRRRGERVEQIVMVTDEGENHPPYFQNAYQAYAEATGLRPHVTLVRVGRADTVLQRSCQILGVAPNVFNFNGDYYSLPNVIPFLTYPSLTEMVMEILQYPLPKRRSS